MGSTCWQHFSIWNASPSKFTLGLDSALCSSKEFGKPPPLNESELPDYSILVPLYHEDGQVKDLVNALERIRWPVERLEIMLICEADDKKTIDACKHETDRPDRFHFSVIPVPVCQPRTKPKAMKLCLAPFAGVNMLLSYDAEDRPHPLQLQEAFDVFFKGRK